VTVDDAVDVPVLADDDAAALLEDDESDPLDVVSELPVTGAMAED
jgi:hypothetical protein